MKKDIQNRSDIQLLVNRFYDKVKNDSLIGFIFTEVVPVNWDRHLTVMYDFWENTLFYTGGYMGNPMETHRRLHKLIPLNTGYFQRWTHLFNSTVDELFAGEKAELAKQRAISISTVIQVKILENPDNINKML